MPSIEYQGLKFTGGKFFIIISLIGAIIGGGWTGYKFYDDYLDMKQQVQEFVAPDLSGFDKRIELIQQEVSMLSEEMQMILSEVELVASTAKELKDDLKSDVRQLEKDSRHTESLVDSIKNSTREELRLFETMIKELEDNLQLELNNPLGNMSAKVK